MLIPDPDGRYDPKDVAAEVASIIRLQPHRWDQGYWVQWCRCRPESERPVASLTASLYAEEEVCGSTACVAGWAAMLTAVEGTVIADDGWLLPPGDGIPYRAAVAGKEALGISHHEALWLFHGVRRREQVLAALDSLAKGEPMTVLPD